MSATSTKTAEDAAKNTPAGGALSTTDPARSDVIGNRKGESENKPTPKEKKDSSLRINIELDLEVEVHLTARVKGDITIGLL